MHASGKDTLCGQPADFGCSRSTTARSSRAAWSPRIRTPAAVIRFAASATPGSGSGERALRQQVQFNVGNVFDRHFVTYSRGVGDNRANKVSSQVSF
jgi:hypothetical protein